MRNYFLEIVFMAIDKGDQAKAHLEELRLNREAGRLLRLESLHERPSFEDSVERWVG